MEKKFRISPEAMRPLAPGLGACFATDMITVDGHRVGFMYRETPERDVDSGWRFMSGLESQSYMDAPEHHGIYDVNTIANYDPEVVPLLDAPVGSSFERKDGTGRLEQVFDFVPETE